MKKLITAIILTALMLTVAPVLADYTSTSAATSTPLKFKKVVNLVCMQTAVEKRDNAIIAALTARETALLAALTARRDALKAAWGISDAKARRKALRTAWDAYKAARKKAANDFSKARKAAWRQFYKDIKSCKDRSGSDLEVVGEGVDTQL
jgi:hypothetical protein